MSDDGFDSVVCVRLSKVIPDVSHLEKINDAVNRIHRITMDATELLSHHLTRCLHHGSDLPNVDKDYIKMVMMEVSIGNGERKKIDDNLVVTRNECMQNLVMTNRKSLDQLMMAQATSIAASFQTNLWFHFRRRVLRYVRMHRMEQMKAHGIPTRECARRCMEMCTDICEPLSEVRTKNADDLEWVMEQRATLGTINFSKRSMSKNVKHHQAIMLQATWIMNRAFEQNGERCTSCTPVRRQFRPAFCSFDTKALCMVLGIATPKGKGSYTHEKKMELWNEVIHLGKDVIKMSKHKSFAGNIRTDGVSARILFDDDLKTHLKKRKRDDEEINVLKSIPTRGIFTIDQIKHVSRTETSKLPIDRSRSREARITRLRGC